MSKFTWTAKQERFARTVYGSLSERLRGWVCRVATANGCDPFEVIADGERLGRTNARARLNYTGFIGNGSGVYV